MRAILVAFEASFFCFLVQIWIRIAFIIHHVSPIDGIKAERTPLYAAELIIAMLNEYEKRV
jgi:hypothetical protein